ncbi:HD domain-containing protein [Clostridium sp.]|uniref:HD domain-containing protein n=1 Tax=Clostridium sp. TaxID=1506 RepID=UPI003216D30D
MEKVNGILNNKTYREYLNILKDLEEDRVFCKHNMEHFLDVARIAYIKVLEEGLDYSKDIIYGTALLHDIGRVLEYKEKIPHHKGSVILSKEILAETDYSKKDVEIILRAIENHRGEAQDELSKIICKSDKLSRNCFNCNSEKDCYWSKEKKNFIINY